MPHLVSAYLLLLTREMVEMPNPVLSEMSFSRIGRNELSSPSTKNWCCQWMMADIVNDNVRWRILTALINRCADSTLVLAYSKASLVLRLTFSFDWYSLSKSVKERDMHKSGTSPLLSVKVTEPSSWVSTMKSGVICSILRPTVSFIEAPGLGFRCRSSTFTSSVSSLVICNDDLMRSQWFLVKSSK